MRALATAMRPVHWAKNGLVFLPLLGAHRADWAALGPALMAFAALSLAASAVYLANDIADREADRAHPRKRFRPVASGALSPGRAAGAAAVLAAGGLGLGAVAGAGPVVAAYLAAALAYSAAVKRVRWLDVAWLAGLHVARVFAGGMAAGIPVSGWLAGFSFAFFLALAALKREAELRVVGAAPGRSYRAADLGAVASLARGAAAAAVGVLAFYVASPQVAALYARPGLLWALCPLAALWLWRLVAMTRAGRMGDDPLVFAFRDPLSLACGALVPVLVLVAA